MHSIIAQLLALTRGYEGKYQLSLEEINLKEMVSDVLAELTEEAAAGGITLIEQVPPRIQLSADQSLMTQLLLNLVENGIKYGKTGGTVAVSALEQDGHILLTIQDDGIGIGEKDLPHIFDRFYRADQARDRSGSGLGLSIVKWIVELHGWTIQAASEPGRGARFTIQIYQGKKSRHPEQTGCRLSFEAISVCDALCGAEPHEAAQVPVSGAGASELPARWRSHRVPAEALRRSYCRRSSSWGCTSPERRR